MSVDKEQQDESLKDLVKKPIDPATADSVKGGALQDSPDTRLADAPDTRTFNPIVTSTNPLKR